MDKFKAFNASSARELTQTSSEVAALRAEMAQQATQAADKGQWNLLVRFDRSLDLKLNQMPCGQLQRAEVFQAFTDSPAIPRSHVQFVRELLELGFNVRCTVNKASWADPLELAPVASCYVVCWTNPSAAPASATDMLPLRPAPHYHEMAQAVADVNDAVRDTLVAVERAASKGASTVEHPTGLISHERRVRLRKELEKRDFAVAGAFDTVSDLVTVSW